MKSLYILSSFDFGVSAYFAQERSPMFQTMMSLVSTRWAMHYNSAAVERHANHEHVSLPTSARDDDAI